MSDLKNKISNGMKIAVSSTNKNIEANVSDVFGRCPYFVIAELSIKEGTSSDGKDQKIEKIEVIKNKSADQTGGAGISSSQLLAEKNVDAVITSNVGPRALDVLNQFNIEIYSGEGVIKDVLQEFMNGKLQKIN